MNLKAAGANYPAISKLMLVIGVFLLSMVVFSLLNLGIAYLFYGFTPLELSGLLDNLSNDRTIEVAKVMQSIASIGFFIIPAFFLAHLFGNGAPEYLNINKGLNKYSVVFTVTAVVVALPLINYLGELNSRMMLPGFLSGIEEWMRDYETKAQHLTEAFLKMETPGQLIANILMIGLLPAIGEELFFRGILQRIFVNSTKSKHWGVWITAIIFSAVHMEFFGFVPRLLLGAMLGYLYVWSGSLWLPIIAHFINNATAVVLTYIYSNDLISFNPNNLGTDDENLMPVVISAFLCIFLIALIYRGEKNVRMLEQGLIPTDVDPIENDKLLIAIVEHETAPPANDEVKEEPKAMNIAVQEIKVRKEVISEIVPRETIAQEGKKKKELFLETGPLETELTNFALTDFSDEAQQEMITRMNLSFDLGSASYNTFLNQFGFIRIENNFARPTGLGLLMLGKSPQLHFPQARIKFTIHREKEEPVIKDFEGPLVLMPGKLESYLDLIVSTSINREQFHRIVLSEIPKKVLREVIINAMVHRDYLIEGARIMVDAFSDRVEVSSPGIPKFPMKKFYDCSVPSVSRNQKISYIFNQMHLVEERGLGMKELKSLKEGGNPPDFKLENDIFTTIIYRTKVAVSKEDGPNLTEDAVKTFIKQKERISAGDYAKRFNVTTKTAQRHLHKLVEEGIVEREGDREGTKYFLKQAENAENTVTSES